MFGFSRKEASLSSEVGPISLVRPSEFPQKQNTEKKVVYTVLPSLHIEDENGLEMGEQETDLFENDLTLLFVADGNDRYGHETGGEGYQAGAKKVIEIAEFLARNQDRCKISSMIAWILSSKNIDHRKPEFFEKIYQAFLALGMKIGLERALVKDNIIMQVEGNLDPLRKKYPQLADLIEEVCAMTEGYREQTTKKPFILKLGIGEIYTRNVDGIIRTGLEQEKLIRASGLPMYADERPIPFFAFTKKWPEIDVPTDIPNIVKALRKKVRYSFKHHSLASLQELAEGITLEKIIPRQFRIFTNTVEEYRTYFEEQGQRTTYPDLCIHLYEESASYITYGNEKSPTILQILPPNVIPEESTETEVIYIAPGQTQQYALIPTELHEARVYRTENLSFIIEAVQAAENFKAPRNYGASRMFESKQIDQIVSTELEYLATLKAFWNKYKANNSLEEIVQRYIGETPYNPNNKQHYKLMMDFFMVAADNFGVQWNENTDHYYEEKQADLNYLKTAFGTIYCPSAPEWNLWQKNWFEEAFKLAIFMRVVGRMDYWIYDLVLPPEQKLIFTQLATGAFILAVSEIKKEINDKNLPANLRKRIHDVSLGYSILTEKLKATGNTVCVENWQEKMIHLFECHDYEWLYQIRQNPFLKDDNHEEFRQKYLQGQKSDVLRMHIQSALDELNNSHQGLQEAIQDLRLFAYICDIEQSIGAGLVLLTLSNLDTAGENIPPNVIEEINTLCFLLNAYFRIMNDLAEIFKDTSDREENIDTCYFAFEKYFLKEQKEHGEKKSPGKLAAAALIQSRIYLYNLAQTLETEFWDKLSMFRKKHEKNPTWKRISINIERAVILGKAFYSREYGNGHYRTVTPTQALEILYQFKDHAL